MSKNNFIYSCEHLRTFIVSDDYNTVDKIRIQNNGRTRI
jgi:hypothetical protein